MFTKTLTAGFLAISLTLASVAPTPAAAQISNEDALTGLLALLLFGAAVHELRDRKDDTPAPQQQRPREQTRDWRVLPVDCLRTATRRNGNTIRYFGQRCLNNTYTHVNRLPERCHVRFRTATDQRRQGYQARCLRDAGFRTNRH